MKYFLLSLILILSACSLNKKSVYWNEDPLKKSVENTKLSKILQKTSDLKKMTFEEFSIFLKDYSDKADYPDINN